MDTTTAMEALMAVAARQTNAGLVDLLRGLAAAGSPREAVVAVRCAMALRGMWDELDAN